MQDELPEICKEYDSLTCEITALTEKINSLDEDIIEKTELIKEYFKILKDGTDVGLNPPSAVHGPLEYFEKKFCDLGDELLSLDEKLTDSKNQLTEMENRLEEVTKEVKETGYIKIHEYGAPLLKPFSWIPPNEAEKYLNNLFITRIV